MAISLLLPVVSTNAPNLFEIVMRMVPRMRAWRFSSANPGSVPRNGSSSSWRNASWGPSIGTVIVAIPRFAARTSESVTLPPLENREGISTPVTCRAPRASTAIDATIAESMPPDSPIRTSRNPFLRT